MDHYFANQTQEGFAGLLQSAKRTENNNSHREQPQEGGQHAQVFIAGVQPAAPFGAEMVPACAVFVKELSRAAQIASPIWPIGVPAHITRLWFRSATQPALKAYFAPAASHAREIWIACQLPTHSEDQMHTTHFAHIWR